MENIIKINDLYKNYSGTEAVNGISLEVFKGEMFGLVGPDGAGKTTVIRILCGLLIKNKGDVEILGMNIENNLNKIKDEIGYLSQKFSLYGDLSVDENIEFFAEIHNVKNYKSRRDELLEFTRLTPFRRRLAENLSGGMKQKLALACTLIHKPQIIFLDEPTTGVDPVSRRDFWKILSDLLKEKITIFMSTPYLDEAERCNRVALMNKGKIISLDTPKNIKENLNKDVAEIICQPIRSAYNLIKEKTDFEVQLFGDRLNVVVNDFEKDISDLQILLNNHSIVFNESRKIPPSLENVFIHLVTKNQS